MQQQPGHPQAADQAVAGSPTSTSSCADAAEYDYDFRGLSAISIEGLLPQAGCCDDDQLWLRALLAGAPRAAAPEDDLIESWHGPLPELPSRDFLAAFSSLRELRISCCNNFTRSGLSCITTLTRLTHLTFEDVFYKEGIPHELSGLSALTRLAEANFLRSDFYGDEVAAWGGGWGHCLRRLRLSSTWQIII
eukprot:XP_001699667.1 predicted protein [Chlamydomonas reinhardtii]